MNRIEKEPEKKEVPTLEQYQILERMCMNDSTIFYKLSLEDRNRWIEEYWERERVQGVWNLVTVLKISSLNITDNVKIEIEDDEEMFLRCKEVVNEEDGVTGETIKEYLHDHTPLLTDTDYESVAREYADYRNNLERGN